MLRKRGIDVSTHSKTWMPCILLFLFTAPSFVHPCESSPTPWRWRNSAFQLTIIPFDASWRGGNRTVPRTPNLANAQPVPREAFLQGKHSQPLPHLGRFALAAWPVGGGQPPSLSHRTSRSAIKAPQETEGEEHVELTRMGLDGWVTQPVVGSENVMMNGEENCEGQELVESTQPNLSNT